MQRTATRPTTTARPVSFEQAKSQYVHRYTMEHVPQWASRSFHEQGTPLDKFPEADKQWPAPQYRTDREWYDNTRFPGEDGLSKRASHCESNGQTWPLGQRLTAPYGNKPATQAPKAASLSELVDAYKAATTRSEQDSILIQLADHPEHPRNK